MKRYFQSSLILLLLSFAVISFAQPARVVTYETKLKVADKAASEGDYYGAMEWFQKAYEESKDVSLQVVIADLQMLARDYPKAEKLYERILKRDKKREFEDIRVDYGRAFKNQGKYREALNEFNTVIADPETDDSLKNIAKLELAGIEMMEKLAPNLEAIVDILPGKVNNGSAESSPALGADGSLYFSSFNRKKEIILDGEDKDYHAKLYVADKNDKGEYDKVEPLPESINRPDFNSGGVSFSRDGNKMYFTRAVLQNNNIESSKLFVSVSRNDDWGAPGEITSLNGDFNIKHPVIGELFGQEVLFYSSNMLGGVGGYDLYYSTISGDTYGVPTNLGTMINTAKDEISPYYNNGTLYFSTNGQLTMGGFDIYYAIWNGSAWEELTNIGFNYNTSYDDMFLRFNDSGSSGFLVSNRPHKDKAKIKGNDACCDDIFRVFIRELVIDLLVTVTDDKGPLNGAVVEVSDLTLGSYPESKSNINTNIFNFPLLGDRNYKGVIKKEGYLSDTITFNTNGIIDDYTVKKPVKLRIDPNYKKEPEVEIITINQPIRLNNILYDLNKWDIKPAAEKDLQYILELMEDYPDMEIELGSHTDFRSDDKYNETLSLKRAQAATNWLVERGIDKKRIKSVGYGEKKPLIDCKKCTEEEHQLNRRTEFKILKGPQTIEIKKEVFKKG